MGHFTVIGSDADDVLAKALAAAPPSASGRLSPRNDIQRAVQLLRQANSSPAHRDGLWPGADALNPDAVAKIFAAKGRPSDHPLIVHLADASQIMTWAREVPRTPSPWRAFWPGPLTLILKKKGVPDLVTGGQDTVGLRVPNHPVALELLRALPLRRRHRRAVGQPLRPHQPDHRRACAPELGERFR
jgi:tRNA threonylcarbamoyl adenosine modification protein (Sua5/YciO/YrdC/YwlC family)